MRSRYLISLLILAVLTLSWIQLGFSQKSSENSLFVNITSHETNRAAMAMFFASKTLSDRGVPVTIFLSRRYT